VSKYEELLGRLPQWFTLAGAPPKINQKPAFAGLPHKAMLAVFWFEAGAPQTSICCEGGIYHD